MAIPQRALTTTAWVGAGLTWLAATTSIGLEVFGPGLPHASTLDPDADTGGIGLVVVEAVVAAAFAALGLLVVRRRPRHPVGWLLGLIGISFATIGLSNSMYVHLILPSGRIETGPALVTWVGNWAWVPGILPLFTLLPLLFPTGRALSRRWAVLAPLAIVGGVLLALDSALRAGKLDGAIAVDNPLGVDHPVVSVLGGIGFLTVLPVAIASIASIVLRFRRSTGVERQQLKWVALAAALLPIAFAGTSLVGDIAWPLMLLTCLLIAAAMAVAMLRYRLYDIDVVINRTLVYGALTVTLAATYVGGVLLLQLVLRPLTERNELAVAGSTLAAAAMFRPARAWIQHWVDRRFYRSRYDAGRTLAAFSGRLRDQVDLAALSADLRSVTRDTLQPAHVSLWVRQ